MHTTLDDWIAREALPCDLAAPATFNTAVDAVMASLGEQVEMLGFGEALHGGEEILQLRNRLFQRLVEAHGFSAIAIESSFPRGQVVNDHVLGRSTLAPAEVWVQGFGNAFGQLEANHTLVEWMRQRNAEGSQPVPLQFYGFDMPSGSVGPASPRQVLHVALDYLSAHHAASGQPRRERIEALLGDDGAWENPAAIMDPSLSVGASATANALRIETEELIAELRSHAPALVASSGPAAYAEALRYATLARQVLNFHAAMARPVDNAERLGVRDVMMFDNLSYILEREQGRGKLLVFAHNSHLKRGQAEWQLGSNLITWWPAGAHLAMQLGPRYAVIGTGLGFSEENGLSQPEAGTLEARLTAAPGPVRFIPTHGGVGLPTAAIAGLPTRSGSAKNPTYFPLNVASFSDFDWLTVLDSATYQRGGPPLQAWESS
jgi:erythromycin esterase-like protein